MKTFPRCLYSQNGLTGISLILLLLFSINYFPQGFSEDNTEPSTSSSSEVPVINAGSIVVKDFPTSMADSIQLDIQDGHFGSQSVGRLKLSANGINFKEGALKQLNVNLEQGDFDNILVDHLNIQTEAFSFDSLELLNEHRFVLDNPVTAAVSLQVTEENLNRFLSSPKTMDKLEKAIAKQTGGIRLIRFANSSVNLLEKERVKLTTFVVLGDKTLVLPSEMEGHIVLENGKVVIHELTMISAGNTLPVDISRVFEQQLNRLIDLERIGRKNHLVIDAKKLTFDQNRVAVEGTSTLTRLEFGKK